MDTLYCGIDLHSNNNVVVVSNDEDKVVYRKRLINEPGIVLSALAPFSAELQGVVVESTYNWYWLVDALMGDGHQVHLANTGAIQHIIPRSDAVGIYWIRPGREPSRDWTRRMRLRANQLSLRTPPRAAFHATWTRPGYRRFSGARMSQGRPELRLARPANA